jgi:hypothetical protein
VVLLVLDRPIAAVFVERSDARHIKNVIGPNGEADL